MKEWIVIGIMLALIAWGEWNTRRMRALNREFERMVAEDKFYSITHCLHCGARLKTKVGNRRGEFLKECPEACETHSLRLPVGKA